ncbi:MAG: hypothetical protein Q9M91_04655 [Candidatus Dojkabacteria bacterium]|nr:hypothetical protein [Candidatus Dojkabacteria bacterium]
MGLHEKALTEKRTRNVFRIFKDSKSARDLSEKQWKDYHVKFVYPEVFSSDFDVLIFDEQVALIELNKTKPHAIFD